MCRMLGIIGNEGVIPYPLLDKFRGLALKGRIPPGAHKGHLDGWGLAGYISNGAEYLGRSFRGADAEMVIFQDAARKAADTGARILLGHLRKASTGETKIENTHPFKSDSWLFCHNGTIYNHGDIPLEYSQPSGDTDSERFFMFIL